MSESVLRERLRTIDRLRAEAKTCTRMAYNWLGEEVDTELVKETTVVVKRRFRRDKKVHTELVMDWEERQLFREWLRDRALSLTERADAISNSLNTKEEGQW